MKFTAEDAAQAVDLILDCMQAYQARKSSDKIEQKASYERYFLKIPKFLSPWGGLWKAPGTVIIGADQFINDALSGKRVPPYGERRGFLSALWAMGRAAGGG